MYTDSLTSQMLDESTMLVQIQKTSKQKVSFYVHVEQQYSTS